MTAEVQEKTGEQAGAETGSGLNPKRARVVRRSCSRPGCGESFTPAARGRRHLYCSGSCRQQAYALRRAQGQIDAGEAAPPTVLRETVCEVLPPEATARQWLELLGALTDQLEDSTTPLAREHWQHARLLGALQRAAAALGAAHPGGLARIKR